MVVVDGDVLRRGEGSRASQEGRRLGEKSSAREPARGRGARGRREGFDLEPPGLTCRPGYLRERAHRPVIVTSRPTRLPCAGVLPAGDPRKSLPPDAEAVA